MAVLNDSRLIWPGLVITAANCCLHAAFTLQTRLFDYCLGWGAILAGILASTVLFGLTALVFSITDWQPILEAGMNQFFWGKIFLLPTTGGS